MAQERECGQAVIHSNEHHAEATENFNGTSSYHLMVMQCHTRKYSVTSGNCTNAQIMLA